jgi:hypothetical protein
VVLIAAGFFVCNGCRENGSLKKTVCFVPLCLILPFRIKFESKIGLNPARVQSHAIYNGLQKNLSLFKTV